MMKRLVFALAAASLLGGCGVLGKGKKPVTPTVGERISVLNTETEIAADPALAGVPVVLPGAATNSDWAQSGGNAAKSMGHLALRPALGQAWRVSIGAGSSKQG